MHEAFLILEDRGAACTVEDPDLRVRVREWRALARRGTIETLGDGVLLLLAPEEPIAAVADLAAREVACCPFYTFTVRLGADERVLEISAGPGGRPSIHAMLGLDPR